MKGGSLLTTGKTAEENMSKKYRLNLYENSIDSLNVGMRMYTDSLEDESMYKFSIIIISNFMELMLKHMVELKDPQLCFVKQNDLSANKKRTITWDRALHILSGSNIPEEELGFFEELRLFAEKLSDIRNNIVHFEFEYDTSLIRSLIVMVVAKLRKLYNSVTKRDFIDDVSEDTKKILETIKDEYQIELHLAQTHAKEKANELETHYDDCNFCGESETAVLLEADEIYCYFCEETDYEIECCRCTELCKISKMECLCEVENGDDLYLCQSCSELLDSEN
jgi:hypothetical protein